MPSGGEDAPGVHYCPGPPGRLSAISVFRCKPVFYGAFVWARRALDSQKRRFPAGADGAQKLGQVVAVGKFFRDDAFSDAKVMRRLWEVRYKVRCVDVDYRGASRSAVLPLLEASTWFQWCGQSGVCVHRFGDEDALV